MKDKDLGIFKERVLIVLENLEKHQCIKGEDLRNRTGIKEPRKLHSVINELRNDGFLIGASKQEPAGYFLIRDDYTLTKWTHPFENSINDQIKTVAAVRAEYEKQKSEGWKWQKRQQQRPENEE